MKKDKQKQNFSMAMWRLGKFALVAALIAVIDHLLGNIGASAYILPAVGAVGAVGTTIASDPAIVTVGEVKSAEPDIDRDYVARNITYMRPARTPLDTILRQSKSIKKVPISSFRTDYYAVDSRPFEDSVTATVAAVSSATSTSIAVPVANVGMWRLQDTVLFEGVALTEGTNTDARCVGIVSAINRNSSTLTVEIISEAAAFTTPALASTNKVVRLGNALDELAAQAPSYATIPAKAYNYVQRFGAQIEESLYQELHDKEVDWNFEDMRAQNLYDFRASMELTALFGKRAHSNVTISNEAKDIYFSGGAADFISKTFYYGSGTAGDTTWDNDTHFDFIEHLFKGNAGSDQRLLLAGGGLITNISKSELVQKQLGAQATKVTWGLTFTTIECNLGTLKIVRHPLFDEIGKTNEGLALDLNFVERHTWLPLQSRTLNLRESGQRNVNAVMIEETSGVVYRYPDVHSWVKVNPGS